MKHPVWGRSFQYTGAMKIPINEYACLNMDAPTLGAEEVTIAGITRWRV